METEETPRMAMCPVCKQEYERDPCDQLDDDDEPYPCTSCTMGALRRYGWL